MRLRNMMLDSGTPFVKSKEIAWTAELPKDEDIPGIIKTKTNKLSVKLLIRFIMLIAA